MPTDNAKYKKDVVNLHGKNYQMVSGRVQMGLDGDPELVARLKSSVIASSRTEILYTTDQYIACKVTITLKDEHGGGTFDGVSEADRKGRSVEGQATLEVAETSARGRAYAAAGICLDFAEFASSNEISNEMEKVGVKPQYNQPQPQQIRPVQPPQTPMPHKAMEVHNTAQASTLMTAIRGTTEEQLFEPQADVIDVGEIPVICENDQGCNNKITEFEVNGKTYGVDYLVTSRRKKFGRALCTPCAGKANKAAKAVASA